MGSDALLYRKRSDSYPESPGDILMKVNNDMLRYKFYRQPKMTIEKLCKNTDTNRTYLARAIYRVYGVHYCKWINTYRVEEAKQLLEEGGPYATDMEDMAQRVGFSSGRSFVRVFTQSERCTPKQYQRLQVKKKMNEAFSPPKEE